LRSTASYASGSSDTPLIGLTIGRQFDRIAEHNAGREALVDVPSGRRWTYGELNEAVDRLATGLLRSGIETGDRVGIWAPNCPEWVVVQLATAKIGAILVTINPAYRSHELRYVINQSSIRLLISAPSFKTSDYRAMVVEIASSCPDLQAVVFLDDDQWEQFASCEADGEAVEARSLTLDFDDPINIQYTSGTTGFPKGATLSHHNILNNGFFVGRLLGYTSDDRVCVPVPFYHCFGMVMGNLGALTNSATVVIPAPVFDPRATLESVQSERCTSLYGVPTMFIAELALPEFPQFDLRSLRTGIMAGSPCPVEVMKRVVAEMNMSEVTIMYGMTETSPVSTMTRRNDEIDTRVSTVGTVMPHVEVKIIDPRSAHIVPKGEAGELCTRGYSVMLGYWDAPDQTADTVDTAGWMHTGDLATMDDDGYVAIVGRIKDMVIRGGENIYPREIEEFLYGHPAIADVQVIGVPDERYGEELMAWIRLKPGRSSLTLDEVRTYCEGKLARFKIPRYIHVVDAFPLTVTGKVRKIEMREQALGILGLEEQP
jgi:fatty-acyl-CoA synthase